MMPRIPWRNEELRYEEINNDDDRKCPYSVQDPGASDFDNSKKCDTLTLELGPSEPVSPLRFGESISTSFAAESPLVPPIHVNEKPRPRLRRSGSVFRRLQSRSAEPTVRRRLSKDLELQRTAMLQSIEQREPGQSDEDKKPRRRRSLEESQKLLGFHSGHDSMSESESNSTDSRINKNRLHDGNHRHHRNMTRLQRSLSPSREWRRSQRSLDSRSSNGEKGDLNRTIRRRVHQRRSDSDLRSMQTRSKPVEGTNGCCIIRPNYSLERPRSFKRRSDSDLQSLQTRPKPVEGTDGSQKLSPPTELGRSQSHDQNQKLSPPMQLRRSRSHDQNQKPSPRMQLRRSRSNEQLRLSRSHDQNQKPSPPMKLRQTRSNEQLRRSRNNGQNQKPSPPMQLRRTRSNEQLRRSQNNDQNQKPSPPMQLRRTRSNEQLRRSRSHDQNQKPSPPMQLRRSESHKRLEVKLARLEEIKKQREAQNSSNLSKFKIKPPPVRKQKREISEICNQAHQRHWQRYSCKRIDSAGSIDDDD